MGVYITDKNFQATHVTTFIIYLSIFFYISCMLHMHKYNPTEKKAVLHSSAILNATAGIIPVMLMVEYVVEFDKVYYKIIGVS